MPAATSGMTCGRNSTVRDDRAEPPVATRRMSAGHQQAERDRDEAEEDDELERVDDACRAGRVGEHGQVVVEPDPLAGPMPFQRRASTGRSGASGSSTNTAYMTRAGSDEQPAVPSARAVPPGAGPAEVIDVDRAAGRAGRRHVAVPSSADRRWASLASSFSYSAWTALSSPRASAGRRPASAARVSSRWAKIAPVALAMKSIAPFSAPTCWPGGQGLGRHGALGDGRDRQVRRPARVGAADGHVDLRGPRRWWRPS